MDLARTGTGIGAAFPGQVRRLAGATVVMGAIVVIAFATTGWLGTASKSESPLADGSYAHVEEVRAAYGFGGSVSDGSYSKVEALRGSNGFVPVRDDSGDRVEVLRGNAPGS
jgi:hypothetical protein